MFRCKSRNKAPGCDQVMLVRLRGNGRKVMDVRADFFKEIYPTSATSHHGQSPEFLWSLRTNFYTTKSLFPQMCYGPTQARYK